MASGSWRGAIYRGEHTDVSGMGPGEIGSRVSAFVRDGCHCGPRAQYADPCAHRGSGVHHLQALLEHSDFNPAQRDSAGHQTYGGLSATPRHGDSRGPVGRLRGGAHHARNPRSASTRNAAGSSTAWCGQRVGPRQVRVSKRRRMSTCMERPRQSCSSARAEISATVVSAWPIRLALPSGCLPQSPSGTEIASSRQWMPAFRRG